MEDSPASVPIEPDRKKQAGEVRAPRRREDGPWWWTEPSVWTGRMLTALEKGVKGGVWFSLIDKVWLPGNLRSAFAQVKSNKGSAGIDHQTIEMFERDLEANLQWLGDQLRNGTYEAQAVRRHWILKPGGSEKRPLGIPTVRDRVVQAAIRHVIEPIFECDFAESSYGFRPGRGCKDALRHVNKLLEQGKLYVVDADIKAYFDSIPHSKLLDLIRSRIADGQMLDLIRAYLTQGVKDGDTEWTPGAGTPQGAVLSPLLANIYLNGLDHLLTDEGFEVVRYADDFVIMCTTEGSARAALDLVKQWTTEHGLTLHPDKTRIAHAVTDGFEFLGYFFRGTKRWPRKKSQQQLKHAVRGITPRTNGQSMSRIIARLNPVLHGWYEYFKHSGPGPLVRMDKWVRMRLRSVLRKRQRGRGIGRGSDHQRWPNAYFAEQGLFSLATAHARDRQSARR